MEFAKNNAKRIVPTILLIIGIVIALMIFIHNNSERIANQNEEYLSEFTAQRAISIDSLIAENLTFIESTAYLYGNSLDSPFADVAVIREFEENSAFDMLRFVDASGDNYTSKGVRANLSDRAYFQAGMRGESGIVFVGQSRVTGEKQVGFYAPVEYGGKTIGVMVGFYGEDYLDRLLEYSLFGFEGEGWLCERDGTVIGATLEDEPDNYFDDLVATGKCDVDERERIAAALAAGENTSFRYHEDGATATAYGVALDQVDWVLVRTFPPSASQQILRNANREGIFLVIGLFALFALYGIAMGAGILYDQRKMREANRNATDISSGVSTLFDAFVVVDLDANEYHYAGVTPTGITIGEQGAYADYCDFVTSRIPEEAHRTEIAKRMSPSSLREALSESQFLSLRVHAPLDDMLWLTYSFIVIERNEDGSPKRLLVVCQDSTELHYKEIEERERLQDALDAAESASRAKTEFLFNMSHDLRTPMNAIIGYTELAQREGVSDEQVHDFIRKIDSSSVHLLSLINDILEMSRIESGKIALFPERTNLLRIIDEVRHMFATQMESKGVTFITDASHVQDLWVLADESKLNRIALNLVSNAYKFTPEGGTVSVTLEQEGRTDDSASFALHVKDSGIGMSSDFVSKLFSPFERERTSTVSKTQGTGLGLSITKQIVDLMGGTIDVDTEQGKGTEFVVRLTFPIAEQNADADAPDGDGAEVTDFTGMRLLLVEDNAINMEIASMILSQAGFELETAINGREAVDAVAQSKPGYYDAVLMDIQMPVMDGYTAARQIRALPDGALSSVPIVAMTANAFQEDVQAARDAGMDGHIAKPIDIDKMLATLSSVLHR